MSQLDRQTAIEWVWRGLSLLALPQIAWSIQLSAEIARSQAQRSHFERRITTLEAQALTRGETLTEIRGLLKELTTQAKYMARDLEELRKGRE